MAAGAGHCIAPTSRGQATAESNKQRPPKRPALVGGWRSWRRVPSSSGRHRRGPGRPCCWRKAVASQQLEGRRHPRTRRLAGPVPGRRPPFPSRSQGPGSSPGPELRVRLCPLPHPRVLCIPTAGPHSDLRPSLSYVSGPIRSGLGLAGRLYKPDRHLLPARAVDGALQTNRGRKR